MKSEVHERVGLTEIGLSNGKAQTDDGQHEVLDPFIARYAEHDTMRLFFRANAANATAEAYRRLVEAMWLSSCQHGTTGRMHLDNFPGHKWLLPLVMALPGTTTAHCDPDGRDPRHQQSSCTQAEHMKGERIGDQRADY